MKAVHWPFQRIMKRKRRKETELSTKYNDYDVMTLQSRMQCILINVSIDLLTSYYTSITDSFSLFSCSSVMFFGADFDTLSILFRLKGNIFHIIWNRVERKKKCFDWELFHFSDCRLLFPFMWSERLVGYWLDKWIVGWWRQMIGVFLVIDLE